MKFEKLGTVNLFWFLVSLFLILWLGDQLIGALHSHEILNLRVTDKVSIDSRPIWFVVVVAVKLIVWLISVAVVVFYIRRRVKAT